jgi:hypothetical protein
MTPDVQLERCLDALRMLPPGGTLELVTTGSSQLLGALQDRCWGEFDWYPLAQDPDDVTRVALFRTASPLQSRQIGEFLTFDHRRCDDLYALVEEQAQQENAAEAGRLFGYFETGMLHHFAMEEERFFPAFEAKTGMRQGPTTVMRMEHEQMRGILKRMRQSLAAGDLHGVVRASGTLLMVMQQHNVKEEQMLYAMGDMHLGSEADSLLRSMQRQA